MNWRYERTDDGWVVLDENGYRIAIVPDPEHKREDDARRIASAPALDALMEAVHERVAALDRRILELARHIKASAEDLEARPDPTAIGRYVRELEALQVERDQREKDLDRLRGLGAFARRAS